MNARKLFSLTAVLVCALAGGAGSVAAPAALARGDLNNEACANEANTGFSGALPDCRAYELVSPPFKDGFGLNFEHLMDGGDRVQAISLGLFDGAVGSRNCVSNYYDPARTASGWSTVSIDAPPPELVYAASTCTALLINGEGESLMQLHPVSQSIYARDLYINRGGAPGYELVGPMLPPRAVPPTPTGGRKQGESNAVYFVAATSNLHHVLFTIPPETESPKTPPGVKSLLWPGDETILTSGGTQMASLYEYAGTNNTTPSLVGVEGSGKLISDCGTFPGGMSGPPGSGLPGNHRNVISTDGEAVFFTAVGTDMQGCGVGSGRPPVNEVFARIGGSQTVAISQPDGLAVATSDEGCSTSLCKSDIEDQANFRDANFEGASEDGTKVFFTSTQQLLNEAGQDPETADSAYETGSEHGGCRNTHFANGCNLYEYDLAQPEGHRLTLVSGGDSSGRGPEVQGVAAVSEDGSHVYFVAKGVLTKALNEYGAEAAAGAENLYVRDTLTEQTAFIGVLDETDARQWPADGAIGEGGVGPMNVTDDGNVLVFTSTAHLTPGDTSAVQQVFRYTANTGALERISVGDEGFNADGNVAQGETEIARAGSLYLEGFQIDQHPTVSENGEIVVFKSSVALTPGALDDKCVVGSGSTCFEYAQNVYEYRGGHVYLISDSSVAPLGISEGADAVSPSGTDVFFQSDGSLLPQDTDTLADIYDARAGGGFPISPSLEPCTGEACQGVPSSPLVVPTSGNPTFGVPQAPAIPPAAPAIKKPKRKPRSAAEIRKKALLGALRTCRRKHAGRRRESCEAKARRHFHAAKASLGVSK